ncbi:hypothetical protein NDU88_002001 [Pleurodeles waltl]|uniref:Uncharacterized protein n=1 Tax=Pleurodeles waltl TaxID=8319 RepID=A0AAV7RA43_PLEWA|nr:hypothetical protein NDU88_002001 [Pleurodeles waltl]
MENWSKVIPSKHFNVMRCIITGLFPSFSGSAPAAPAGAPSVTGSPARPRSAACSTHSALALSSHPVFHSCRGAWDLALRWEGFPVAAEAQTRVDARGEEGSSGRTRTACHGSLAARTGLGKHRPLAGPRAVKVQILECKSNGE